MASIPGQPLTRMINLITARHRAMMMLMMIVMFMIMMMMVMARMINLITIGLKSTELERLSKKKTASEEKEKSLRILYHGKFCENLCGSVGG